MFLKPTVDSLKQLRERFALTIMTKPISISALSKIIGCCPKTLNNFLHAGLNIDMKRFFMILQYVKKVEKELGINNMKYDNLL